MLSKMAMKATHNYIIIMLSVRMSIVKGNVYTSKNFSTVYHSVIEYVLT